MFDRDPLPNTFIMFLYLLILPLSAFWVSPCRGKRRIRGKRLYDYLLLNHGITSREKRDEILNNQYEFVKMWLVVALIALGCYAQVAMVIHCLRIEITDDNTCYSGVSIFEAFMGIGLCVTGLLALSVKAKIDFDDRGERMRQHKRARRRRLHNHCTPSVYLSSHIMKLDSGEWRSHKCTQIGIPLSFVIALSPFLYRYMSDEYSTLGVCLKEESPWPDWMVMAQAIIGGIINASMLYMTSIRVELQSEAYPERYEQIRHLHALVQGDFRDLPEWIPVVSLGDKASVLRWAATREFIVDFNRIKIAHTEIQLNSAVAYLGFCVAVFVVEYKFGEILPPNAELMFLLFSGYACVLVGPMLIYAMFIMLSINNLEQRTRIRFKAASWDLQVREIAYGKEDPAEALK